VLSLANGADSLPHPVPSRTTNVMTQLPKSLDRAGTMECFCHDPTRDFEAWMTR
jgi:hypothetical protein